MPPSLSSRYRRGNCTGYRRQTGIHDSNKVMTKKAGSPTFVSKFCSMDICKSRRIARVRPWFKMTPCSQLYQFVIMCDQLRERGMSLIEAHWCRNACAFQVNVTKSSDIPLSPFGRGFFDFWAAPISFDLAPPNLHKIGLSKAEKFTRWVSTHYCELVLYRTYSWWAEHTITDWYYTKQVSSVFR